MIGRAALLARGGLLLAGMAPAAAAPLERPDAVDAAAARVELGRRLFYEADLSINGTMSCATCHEQHRAFADGNATHPGALDDPGRRNVPGLANVGTLTRLTWADPGQDNLERQIDTPMLGHNPVEMAMDGHTDAIAVRLGRDPCYTAMFRTAFPGENAAPDYAHAVRAIAAFERTVVSQSAPWDRWRAGERDALSQEARTGAALFTKDCAGCHTGNNLTDEAYHRILPAGADAGLMEVTGNEADRGSFRTPSLRNVALTAPYFHDGSAPYLESAIKAHAGFAAIAPASLARLTAFLDSLTDRAFITDPAFALPMQACGKPL